MFLVDGTSSSHILLYIVIFSTSSNLTKHIAF